MVELYEMGDDARAELGAAGREFTQKHFNFDDFIQRWDDLFTSLSEEKGSWDSREGYKSYDVRTY